MSYCVITSVYLIVGIRSEMTITSSQTATMTGANSTREVSITSSLTVTMTGANSTREVSITSSLTATMTGANSSLDDLAVTFIAIAAVVTIAVLLVASMIVIGVVMYRHKRFRNAHNDPGPRYVFLTV